MVTPEDLFLLLGPHAHRGVVSGGEIFMPVMVAGEVIHRAASRGYATIGIDFYVSNTAGFVPVIPVNSLDCSSLVGNIPWSNLVAQCLEEGSLVLDRVLACDPTQWCTLTLISRMDK